MTRFRRHARRRLLVRSLVILAAAFVVLGGGALWTYRWSTGASGPSTLVTVEVPPGATVSDVGELLEDADVIRSALAFRIAATTRGVPIQAGRYNLATNMQLGGALEALEAGPILETTTLTIPEGLRLEQVAGVAAEELGIGEQELLSAATSGDYALPPYLPEDARSVEGFLYPKTYELTRDVNADDLIRRLLAQFEEEASGLDWENGRRLGLTPYEVVILASLIEREARIPRDRPKIASVIYNRLERGMPLQIDATVQYALPEHKPRLTYEDYEYESPYNTYLHQGLPPTPIASPGLASLKAALDPAQTGFFFYLVVDESGRHGFAETYEEFLRLKERVQSGA